MSKTKPIEYTLEIYKPIELQGFPADECRYYRSSTPFPAVNVGDQVTAWIWKFPKQSIESLQKAMGGRTIEPLEPVAVVESVLHDVRESVDVIRCRIIIQTTLYRPESC